MKNVLLLDNHDSFTYNMAEILRRNDKVSFKIISSKDIRTDQIGSFDKIIFSPGPGLPDEQPAMFNILRSAAETTSILGVCLGFQAIVVYFGGKLFNLPKVIHGQPKKVSALNTGHRLFQNIPPDFVAGLYHSWAVAEEKFPACLEITAVSEDGIIMGAAHKTLDICGVQFHPESVLTPLGQKMIANWLET